MDGWFSEAQWVEVEKKSLDFMAVCVESPFMGFMAGMEQEGFLG